MRAEVTDGVYGFRDGDWGEVEGFWERVGVGVTEVGYRAQLGQLMGLHRFGCHSKFSGVSRRLVPGTYAVLRRTGSMGTDREPQYIVPRRDNCAGGAGGQVVITEH